MYMHTHTQNIGTYMYAEVQTPVHVCLTLYNCITTNILHVNKMYIQFDKQAANKKRTHTHTPFYMCLCVYVRVAYVGDILYELLSTV